MDGGKLTREQREEAIEAVLSLHENRWVERMIRAAPNRREAVRWARRNLTAWRVSGPGRPVIEGTLKGVAVFSGGRLLGLVTWEEVVDYVREPRQLSLF